MNATALETRRSTFVGLITAGAMGSLAGHVVLWAYSKIVTGPLVIAGAQITGIVMLKSGILWAVLFGAAYLLSLIVNFVNARPKTSRVVENPQADKWQQQLQSVISNLEDQHHENKWKGFRQFVIDKRISECPDHSIVSFYLKPYDRGPIPRFKPGQHLAFRLDHVPGQAKSVVRCYSLSDSYHGDFYRVSIKRVPAPPDKPELPPGISSNYFHDQLKVGDFLDVRAPSGNFYLDAARNTDSVLIAGGVGITPVLSMLNTLIETGSTRQVWFFYGVINSEQHAMKEHLENIARNHPNVHLMVCYSRPLDTDREGLDYHSQERVSVDLFKKVLPSSNFEFYMCGPPPMMKSITEGLAAWGVPDKHVHLEAFGPASVPKKSKPKADAPKAAVEFQVEGETFAWTGEHENLLTFAEDKGVELPSGCRMGNCGSCMTLLLSGAVEYPGGKPGFEFEAGSCLPCCCVPIGNISLEA
ncbi:MAG TPA: 2Fe-2S iron-sulfur cluster-binding protein [Gammaproteobacteria bacterium]